MTTPTPHGAMPELPAHLTNVLVITSDSCHALKKAGQYYYTADQMREYARAAIQQAAGAVPEGMANLEGVKVIDVLTRCAQGIDNLAEICRRWEPDHSSAIDRRNWLFAKDAADDARRLLAEGSSDHLVPCAGGGVTKWRITKWGNCPVCHRDRIPSEACARNGCPDAPTGQIENLDKISTRHCGHPDHPGCDDCSPAPREDGHG